MVLTVNLLSMGEANMSPSMRTRLCLWLLAVPMLLLGLPAGLQAQGVYFAGGGASHLSMGGASTATPVDAIGALYWNPAAIGRYGRSEVNVGGGFLFPISHLDAAALRGRAGRTTSDSGVGLVSDVGMIFQPEERQLTFGLGLTM